MACLMKSTGKSWFKYFQYDPDRDSPNDVRNILLIIATLIATVTFQAGVTPPGGVWQEGKKAGKAIFADHDAPFFVFMATNTMALSASILVIISLTFRFPFNLEIVVATISMLATYVSAIVAVTGKDRKFAWVMFAGAAPFIVRCLIQMFNQFRKQ